MQRFTGLYVIALLATLSIGVALADSPQANVAADVAAIKQIEQEMGTAMVAGDVSRLKEIYADDFATFGSQGKVITKKLLIDDFAAFHDKLVWFENGPLDVQVFGNIALAQGSVKEKRSRKGEEFSGEYAWIDVLEKRGDKWLVVRSASAKIVRDNSRNTGSTLNVVETIKDMEQKVGDAMVAPDLKKIDESYDENWLTIGSTGTLYTKKNLIDDFRTGDHTLVSFELGPMYVQVLGNIALAQASVKEKRFRKGVDISGQFAFMDLLENRGGKWVIMRTLGRKTS